MMKYSTIAIIFLTSYAFGQSRENVILPTPQISWDSLRNFIVYPEIARRSGLEGLFKAHLTVDSIGNLTSLKILNGYNDHGEQDDTTIIDIMLYDKLRSIQWNPATIDGRRVSHDLTIPFIIIIERPSQSQPMYKTVEHIVPIQIR